MFEINRDAATAAHAKYMALVAEVHANVRKPIEHAKAHKAANSAYLAWKAADKAFQQSAKERDKAMGYDY